MVTAKRPPAPSGRSRQSLTQYQNNRARLYSALLLLQYGAQPLLSKRCNGRDVIMTSVVLACEVVKVACALLALQWGGALSGLFASWSVVDALRFSALPAVLYACQNTLLQLSYRNLDALTFSLLNQTKLIFTALFTYLLLRQKQSVQQVFALVLLLLAAACLSFGQRTPQGYVEEVNAEQVLVYGIIPVLAASLLSGLASTLCQWAAQMKRRNTYLMTVEMSIFGSIGLLASMLRSPDGKTIGTRGFFYGWTVYTLVPIFTNAVGGILVGLVTSSSGGVKKGFVIVSALLVTALLQFLVEGIPPSRYVSIALPLVVSSSVIHQRYPYKYNNKDE